MISLSIEEGYAISVPGIMEPFYDTFHHQPIHCNGFIIYRASLQRYFASTTMDASKGISWNLESGIWYLMSLKKFLQGCLSPEEKLFQELR